MSGKIWHLKRGRYLLCWMFRYSILLKLFLVHTCKDFLMRSKCILPLMNYWKPIFKIEKKMFLFHLPKNFFKTNIFIIYLLCFLVGWKTFEAKFLQSFIVKSANTHMVCLHSLSKFQQLSIYLTRVYCKCTKRRGEVFFRFCKKSAPLWMFGGAIFLKWFSPLS